MRSYRNLLLAAVLGADSGLALAQATAEDRVNQAMQILGIAPEPAQGIAAPAPQAAPAAPAPPAPRVEGQAEVPTPSLSPELEKQARDLLRLTKTPAKSKPAQTAPPPAGTTPLRPEDQRRLAEDARARARGSARPSNFIIDPAPAAGPTPEEQARAEAMRREEIAKIEAEILQAAQQQSAAPGATPPAAVPAPATAPIAAIAVPTPAPPPPVTAESTAATSNFQPLSTLPAANATVPSPSTSTSEDAERRAREVLERKMAEVYGTPPPVAAAPSSAPPPPVAPPPAVLAPVAAPTTPAPAVGVAPVTAAVPNAPDEVRLAEEEAKARARLQEEVEARTRGEQQRDERERTASTKLKGGRAKNSSTSSSGALLKSKEQRLAELLEAYQQDRITPGQYHQERAKVLAEP